MSSIIQDARDVLAKWRAKAEPLDIAMFGPLDEPLIVGTAGNPELLDIVDDILREGQEALAEIEASGSTALMQLVNATGGGRSRNAVRLAAAIVAADKRMSA